MRLKSCAPSTVMQEHTLPTMRARVFGLLGAGVTAGIPLGTLASGFVVTWIGLRATLDDGSNLSAGDALDPG